MSDLYMIVGFEVQPCSVKRTPGKPIEAVECGPDANAPAEPQIIETGVQVVYSYDVFWWVGLAGPGLQSLLPADATCVACIGAVFPRRVTVL